MVLFARNNGEFAALDAIAVPIVISIPEVDGPFGPGHPFAVSSNFIGPVLNPRFTISVSTADNEHLIWSQVEPSFTGSYGGSSFFVQFNAVPTPNRFLMHGDPARLDVTFQGDGGTVETATRTIKTDLIQGLQYELRNQIQGVSLQVSALASGGFSATDRAQLATIQANTTVPMGVGSGIEQIPMASFFSHPPVGFLKVGPLFLTASGDGSIDGDSGLLPTLFGLWWEFSAVPEGYGLDLGIVPEFEIRMLQLRTIYTLNGVEFVRDYADLNVERVLWLWQEAKPTRVDYSISPGVEVQFHYIQWISL